MAELHAVVLWLRLTVDNCQTLPWHAHRTTRTRPFVALCVPGPVPGSAWSHTGDNVGTPRGPHFPPIPQQKVLPGDPANLPLTLVEGLPHVDLPARSHGCQAFPCACSACAHSKACGKPSEAVPPAALPQSLAPDRELGTCKLGSRLDRGQPHHSMPVPAAKGCPPSTLC